jgi:hypothetical protein
MNYEQAIADIVSRLSPLTAAQIDVVHTPENQNEFERPFTTGKISVGYKGSKWEKPKSTAEISQDEEVMFELAIQSRKLRGSKGIYAIKKLLIQVLVGFQPTDCDRLYCKESGVTGLPEVFKDGVWTYSLIVCARNVTVEDFEEDLSVIMSQFINKDDTLGGQFTVDSPTEITDP